MAQVQIQEMMETGAHFGHQTKRWNPKMRPYIYGERSGVHIIDLGQTKDLADYALNFIQSVVAGGEKVLFVGTKMQARKVIKEQAKRAQMHYVNNRWMGGTLTNFHTIKKSIDRLIDLETRRENNDFQGYTKKELLDVDRKVIKLEASLGGIKSLNRSPGVVFVIDPTHERIAVREAKKLNIPIVALVDTNCDPDPVDHLIPANDDALGSIVYFVSKVADACLEGLADYEKNAQQKGAKSDADQKPGKRRRVSKGTEKTDKPAFVDKSIKEEKAADSEDEGSFSAKAETETKTETKTEVRAAAAS